MATEISDMSRSEPLKAGVFGTNLEQAKEHNLRAVIDALRRHGALTRAEITRATALSVQTISNLVAELEQRGLLIAGEPQKAKRGQPAKPYFLNPEGGYSIGIQMDHQLVLAKLVNMAGVECLEIQKSISRPSPEEGLEIFAEMVEQLLAKTRVDSGKVFGVGIAIPGPYGISGPTGVGPGWVDFPIEQRLGEKIGLPVRVENDANAAAIAERLHGEGKKFDTFLYVFIGMGLGAGLFLNGQIYHGVRGAAGEIGHIIVEPEGRLCDCGNRGCLERYVSLCAAYEAIGETQEKHRSPEQLEKLLDQKDPAFMGWLTEAAEKLRRGIHALESIFDPEVIFIGGLLPPKITRALVDMLIPPLPSVVSQLKPQEERILLGISAPSAPAQGAASVPIFYEFNIERQSVSQAASQSLSRKVLGSS
ncbi:ROK family transcriptional regulator [Kiloniella laminariae]|uniref:ROK family transcriptional regulator n=1 Tax=Kiloniella laminariae TaxID=454162 RepID=UPI0003733C53|nr:ROK family transcriptional regulator [Kiloniella laminariae]